MSLQGDAADLRVAAAKNHAARSGNGAPAEAAAVTPGPLASGLHPHPLAALPVPLRPTPASAFFDEQVTLTLEERGCTFNVYLLEGIGAGNGVDAKGEVGGDGEAGSELDAGSDGEASGEGGDEARGDASGNGGTLPTSASTSGAAGVALTPPSASAPIWFLCLHGAGYTGVTWGPVAALLRGRAQAIAPDARGHGLTSSEDEGALDADTLARDAAAVWRALVRRWWASAGVGEASDGAAGGGGDESGEFSEETAASASFPRTIVVGHSMGGAIGARVAELLPRRALLGCAVIDVVEGSAMAALPSMDLILRRRPVSFSSLDAAAAWALESGQCRRSSSLLASLPSQLVRTDPARRLKRTDTPVVLDLPDPHAAVASPTAAQAGARDPAGGLGAISEERELGGLLEDDGLEIVAEEDGEGVEGGEIGEAGTGDGRGIREGGVGGGGASGEGSVGGGGASGEGAGAPDAPPPVSAAPAPAPAAAPEPAPAPPAPAAPEPARLPAAAATLPPPVPARRPPLGPGPSRVRIASENKGSPSVDGAASPRMPPLPAKRAASPTSLDSAPSRPAAWAWRTPLAATRPFWSGWFRGLSERFLALPCAKLLILAGTDRLDTALTRGQMQGKFQLQLFPEAGHAIQEDEPEKTADTLLGFLDRYAAPAAKIVGGKVIRA